MKTIVAYTLRNEDYTAELIRKQGLFWYVRDCDGNEIKIPAKAVDETWEEAEDPLPADTQEEAEDPSIDDEDYPEQDNPTIDGFLPAPRLAQQALAGPVTAEPGDNITLAELCDKYGVVARIARRKLRAQVSKDSTVLDPCLATEGHEHRESWIFKRSAIDTIMKILTTTQRG